MDKDEETENPFLQPKTIAKLASFFGKKQLLPLRLLSKAWSKEVHRFLGTSPPLCFKDVEEISCFMDCMRNTKDFCFTEVVLAADTTEPIVAEFITRFGSQFQSLAIVDWNVKMPFLKNLFLGQTMFIRLLSVVLEVENFNGLSFDFHSSEPALSFTPILPSLIGLCLHTAGGEGDFTALTGEMLTMAPRLENIALHFKPIHAPSLSEIFCKTNDKIEKLFLAWDLNEDDVNALVNTKWKLTHLRLALRNETVFSPLAFHAVLDRFSDSLRRISNFSLAKAGPDDPDSQLPSEGPWFHVHTVPENLKSLRTIEFENVAMDPIALRSLEYLSTLRLRPHTWENVMLMLGPGSLSKTLRTLIIEEIDCIEDSMAQRLIERISAVFPALLHLTTPISDTLFIQICLLLRNLQELVLDGILSDEGVTGFSPAVIRRLSEGHGDTGDSEDVQLIREAANRRPGNVTEMWQLKRFCLTNAATGHALPGFTDVGIQYGLLQCPRLLYIDI